MTMPDEISAPTPAARHYIPIQPSLDWAPRSESAASTPGDAGLAFAAAVNRCDDNGLCRRDDNALMCPSYQISHDARHSPQARADTLRRALSGEFGDDGIASDEVRQSLDLCVSCKGCLRECPAGVDIAKMKLEHLQQYKRKHGFTVRDNLIARLPVTAPFAAKHPGWFNARNRLPWLARLAERLFGFTARRAWPQWRSDTVWNTVPRQPAGPVLVGGRALLDAHAAGERTVVLFVDTFSSAFERENVDAAIAVLGAAGYKVHIPRWAPQGDRDERNLCCGRTFLAAGMVEAAKQQAHYLLSALLEFAEAGIDIVGLEPACLFTLRDEIPAMKLGEEAATVAQHAILIDTFLEREASAGKLDALRARLKPATAPMLVHGHCHTKVFAGMSSTLAVLALIPNARATLIDSACCGMAGAFGYDATHYDASMQMAERSLLPAIRNAPDALIVADGTSCRQQIQHGTTREARHAIRVLAEHLQQ